ncbi:MAG: outer membrane beta-barrel protein [Pseudomonadota bacterium]
MRSPNTTMCPARPMQGAFYAACLAAATLAAAPALAQDSGWRYAGCHAGVHAGGLWGQADDWTVKTPGGDFFGQSLGSHSLSSGIGGIQAGCDIERDGFVLGLGGDYSWADASGSHPSRLERGVFYSSRISGTGAVTARAGYRIDRILGYVRAGLAWQNDRYEASTIITGPAFLANELRTGWNLGVGGEYSVTDRFGVFLEYDYRDYGDDTIGLTPLIPGLGPASVAIDSRTSVVRAGVNLRF